MPTDIDWKAETRKQWNATPCGTGSYLAQLEPESLKWFKEISRSRYEDSDPWMKRTIPFKDFAGAKLLEVGHGIGSDLLTFAEAGALVHGIDITTEHHRLALKNFELHQRPVELKLCDASAIAYADDTFDVVYSHGVLHHTPDIEACLAEMRRVLKPGGHLILSMYYTWSAFHWTLLVQGLRSGQLFRLGYRGLMARIEAGADGVHVKPLVRTCSKRAVRRLLSHFEDVDFKIAHFDRSHLAILGGFVPHALEQRLESILGWYVIAFARKPLATRGDL